MPCYHPVTAWYSANKAPSGKRKLVFQASGGFGLPIQVPCQRCIGCRLERARQWAIRCVHESALHEENSFLTLTYSPENLPANGSLQPRDTQLFLKRLRKHLGTKLVRYFLCGEYGDRLERPHYHVLLFGHAFLEDRVKHRNTPYGYTFTSPTLDRIWGLGLCEFGTVTSESAGYVARYSLKKMTGQVAAVHYTRVDRHTGEITRLEPEFARMSRASGIGKAWFDQFKADVYPDDFCLLNGVKAKTPRFYDKQLDAEELLSIKAKRIARARLAKVRANSTPDRLAVREEVTRSRIKTLIRD